MKKIAVALLVLTCLLGLAGCSSNEDPQKEETILTMEKVKELAKKGENLTWSDFEQYPYEDIGSGLYICRYEIDQDYYLLIGGNPNLTPMYIKLVSMDDNDKYIDIRTESIEDFIE